MNRFASVSKKRAPSSFLLACVSQTTYFLGYTVRRAMDIVAVPYQIISGRSHRDGDPPSKPARQSGIPSRRSRTASRSQLVEQMPIDAGRGRGSDGHANGHRATVTMREVPTDTGAESLLSALRALRGSCGEDSSLLILDALHDRNANVRCAAAAAAAEAGTFTAVFSLILLLDDPVFEVRREAKAAIARITRSKVDFDPSADAPIRKKTIDRLKEWWKDERFSRLAAEVQTGLKS